MKLPSLVSVALLALTSSAQRVSTTTARTTRPVSTTTAAPTEPSSPDTVRPVTVVIDLSITIREDEEYLALFQAGVKHLVLTRNFVFPGGRIFVPPIWLRLKPEQAETIHEYALQYNATVSLGLSVGDFVENLGRDLNRDILNFTLNAQAAINEYFVDGIHFDLSSPFFTPEGEEWDVINSLMDISRRRLKSSRGGPAITSITLRPEDPQGDVWQAVLDHKPWEHADETYCLLSSFAYDPELQIGVEWPKTLIEDMDHAGADLSKVSLGIAPIGFSKDFRRPRSYDLLVADGAPVDGNGTFVVEEGFGPETVYYNTQRQIREKAELLDEYGLHGFENHLPLSDIDNGLSEDSLLYAQLHS
ncbi:hypothetical protein FOZ60_017278 [Perkinsus olseni]|nr:hypothetical protein FOZ60_017278 [Perkinsus olseni]